MKNARALRRNQRGFILSGLALLLILPAVLLASSCLTILEYGSKTTALQATMDKVSNTGKDIESMIEAMWDYHIPFDSYSLDTIARLYASSTGLSVDIAFADNVVGIKVQDLSGTARYYKIFELE